MSLKSTKSQPQPQLNPSCQPKPTKQMSTSHLQPIPSGWTWGQAELLTSSKSPPPTLHLQGGTLNKESRVKGSKNISLNQGGIIAKFLAAQSFVLYKNAK